uniref:Uncharacterized protein n=1 Tax=Phenylobacterium glaciei TaxID=2803784 RepID=A0A974S9D4_9CAUL|nr:hypothetical protein JKL49_21080 [Phenylobacterium glaciei]
MKNEGVKDLLDKTEKTARESGSFPFLDADEFSESAKNYWDACFNAIVQLSEIENELKERSESVRNGPLFGTIKVRRSRGSPSATATGARDAAQ